VAVEWGPLAAGAPSHGTTGTMDKPALGLGLGFAQETTLEGFTIRA